MIYRITTCLFLMVLCWAVQVSGFEIEVDGSSVLTQAIPITITDSVGNSLTGQVLADVALYYSCTGQTDTVFNETGDTLTEVDASNSPGQYSHPGAAHPASHTHWH